MHEDDPFAVIAAFYDLDVEGYDEDLAWYAHLVSVYGGPVLELGCGTGRVCAAVAEAGAAATGVDISAAMLERARARVAGGAAERLVEWVQADLRDLDLGRHFSLVLVPLGSLQHMETASDVVRALETVARHLEPGGRAVVDVEAPGTDLAPGPQPLFEHWTHTAGDQGISKLVAVEGRPALGVREITWHFDVRELDGLLRRHTQQFVMRAITPGELELAARLAGLRVESWFGDYGVTPLDDAAERLVAVLAAVEDES